MEIKWNVAAQATACGLGGLVLVWVTRILKQKQFGLSLLTAVTVFLGFSVLPAVPPLLSYPFLEPKPDLADLSLYLAVAGLALLWAVYETFRQGLR